MLPLWNGLGSTLAGRNSESSLACTVQDWADVMPAQSYGQTKLFWQANPPWWFDFSYSQ
jgi:hypothetical protein